LLDKYDQPEATPRLEIFCFGRFEVFRAGGQIRDAEWKGRQAKMLLKRLVAEHGRKCPRDIVRDMLWPDAAQEMQRTNLSSLVYRMRKVLDAPVSSGEESSCIAASDDLLALNASQVWTDVGQFLSHLGKAARLKTGEPARSLEEYEKACKLYRGDFLPDDLYDDWAAVVREQLRERYFKALREIAETFESLGNRAKAAEAYTKLFQTDECNEEACRRVMSHHLSSGNRNEAVRIYERCQLALKRSLDMEPEERTRKLYRSIIGG
jgi:DNA-binding SARP family transcriptional activator